LRVLLRVLRLQGLRLLEPLLRVPWV